MSSDNPKALAIIPRGINEVMALALELSKATTVAPEFREKPANVLAAIMAGAELNFAPMAALRSVHIIKGVPKLTADAMVAAVLVSGKAEYFEPSTYTTTSVTYVTKRIGSTREQSCTWTAEDAKRAGLMSDNHRLYPRQMLASRAKSELARMIYPDVCAGLYTDDEIPSEQTRTESQPSPAYTAPVDAIDAEVIETDSILLKSILDDIEAQPTESDLKTLSKIIKEHKLQGSAKEQANAAYAAKQKALKSVTNGVVTPAVAEQPA